MSEPRKAVEPNTMLDLSDESHIRYSCYACRNCGGLTLRRRHMPALMRSVRLLIPSLRTFRCERCGRGAWLRER